MIHQCDKPCGNKTASGYCATTACINPQYSNIIGTVQYGQGVQKRIITNADRIRAMTGEELAAFFAQQEYRKPVFDGWLPLCNHVMGPRTCHENGCEKCWLEWLKQEEKNHPSD